MVGFFNLQRASNLIHFGNGGNAVIHHGIVSLLLAVALSDLAIPLIHTWGMYPGTTLFSSGGGLSKMASGDEIQPGAVNNGNQTLLPPRGVGRATSVSMALLTGG
jgi:hypothetical protein